METSPLVSIIMPLYNAEKYVDEAIMSVINQTYQNWELIIVNDGSTDASFNVAKSYESDKIKVYNQKNKGASAARNFGYYQSNGDFIKFFDSDDLLSSNMLEEQTNRLRENTKNIASAQWGRFYNNDLNTFKANPEDCWQDMKPADWICSSWHNAQPMTQPGIFLIPKSILEIAGLWDERLSLIDDFDFFTRILLSSNEIKFCSQSILYYRSGMGDNALSGQKSRKAVESAFLSLKLGAEYLLSIENSDITRLCCANMWQGFVYEFYFQYKDLAMIAEKKIKELGGSDYNFPCGKITRIFVFLFGWKIAKRIRILFK